MMATMEPPAVAEQLEMCFPKGLEAGFLAFHGANPEVYNFLVARAREWKDGGHTHGSIRMFWEAARFEFCKEVKRTSRFRLNNNHHAFYSRLIMKREPDLAGFFETREQEHPNGGGD
jgi:hypothetical protein